MNEAPAFELRGVRQVKAGQTVLHDLDLSLPRGQVTSLIGPSGAGKSVLLRLLNRLDDPAGGEIRYRGEAITELPVRTLRCRVGFVFQVAVPFPGTVADNLTTAGAIAGVPADAIPDRLAGCVRLAGLDDAILARDAARLSVGQLQRVGLARALMSGPETLVLDEPTASLDPETADTLIQTIASLRAERGLTVVMATHRLKEARQLSDYVVMLDGGAVVEAGPAGTLFASSQPRLRAFLDRGT